MEDFLNNPLADYPSNQMEDSRRNFSLPMDFLNRQMEASPNRLNHSMEELPTAGFLSLPMVDFHSPLMVDFRSLPMEDFLSPQMEDFLSPPMKDFRSLLMADFRSLLMLDFLIFQPLHLHLTQVNM